MIKIFRLMALLSFVLGCMLLYTGVAHRAPGARWRGTIDAVDNIWRSVFSDGLPGLFKPAISGLRGLSSQQQELWGVASFGALPVFAVAALVAFALIFAFLRIYAIAERLSIEKKEERQTTAAQKSLQARRKAAGVADSAAGSIDESMLDISEPEDEIFRSMEHLVALAHSTLDDEQCRRTIRVVRPDLLPHYDSFSTLAMEKFCKRILDHRVITIRREASSLSPDQFVAHDKKMNELARETVCRRFMPHDPSKILPDEIQHIGKAFTSYEQSKIQQDTLTGAEDWIDVSLRNSVSVMQMEPPVKPQEVNVQTPEKEQASGALGASGSSERLE